MRVLMGILAVAATAQAALAQTGPVVTRAPARSTATETAHNAILVRPGYVVNVTVTEPFTNVVVGNPDMIDALAQTDRTFVVQAKPNAAGDTNIILTNTTGQVIHNLAVRVAASGAGNVKVHTGGGRATIHDFNAYSCSDDHCSRLPRNKERIQDPVTNVFITSTTAVSPTGGRSDTQTTTTTAPQ